MPNPNTKTPLRRVNKYGSTTPSSSHSLYL